MKIVADFHIHSKYSRATSQKMNLEYLFVWAQKKGVNILGTGDFTHPVWFKELKEKLEEAEDGLYKIKSSHLPSHTHLQPHISHFYYFRFILTGEISVIYSCRGKVRKIHHLVFVPNFETAEKINTQLSWVGNLEADGRPILGMDSKELLKIVLESHPDSFLVPAHAWTPWFGIFGSKSGFDSLNECFGELSKEIFSIETGLSSSPDMNWRLSFLDRITLISNSDAHSPGKIAREANVFEIEKEKISFKEIKRILKEKDRKKFLYTIEFFPQEGKYYFDGHRSCEVCFSPEETKKYNGVCPKCGRSLTLGVMNRIENLADRKKNFIPENAIPFKSLVPLEEIIKESLNQNSFSKIVEKEYQKLIENFSNELKILLEVSLEDLKKIAHPMVVEGIKRVREGKVFIFPGFDGEYGKVSIFEEKKQEKKDEISQETLF